MEMILGTVQLGLDYGINNHFGKPDKNIAFQILEEAYNHKVRFLDTASAYGDSEKIIGEFQRNTGCKFQISTKCSEDLDKVSLLTSFEHSCERLCVKEIDIYYLHSFSQCKNVSAIESLIVLKAKKKIRRIGISIYSPEEMDYILNNLPEIDIIQFPFNILDCYRWKKSHLFDLAYKRKKQLYARSIFLQGLIFNSETDRIIKKLEAQKYISYLRHLALDKGLTIQELAFAYVNSVTQINGMIIGCETKKQLKNNIHLFKKNYYLSKNELDTIENYMCDIPDIIVDPRQWERR